MKIAVAQINTTVGDFEGNADKMISSIRWGEEKAVDIVLFPELSVCGYPPRDLLEKPDFVRRNILAVERIAKETANVAAAVGYVSINEEHEGRGLFNSAAVLHKGEIKFVQNKTLLPEYDVFDEVRHFEPARECGTCKIAGKKIGLSMCEDIWSFFEYKGRRIYHKDPIHNVVGAGAKIVLNLSASPFTIGKHEIRRSLVCGAAKRCGRPVVYCNLVGGNDELVFDGRSFVVDEKGEIIHEGKAFEEDIFVVDLDSRERVKLPPELSDVARVRRALRLGLHDYMRKCGFKKAVIGLSGGIDSAVVAAIACEAIDPSNVLGVLMPSPYTSHESIADALALAKNLKMVTCQVSIGDIYESYRKTLGYVSEKSVSVAEENIQARIRGNILMSISNRDGALVLSTGNKSEMSVGYCTLYGDMAGGFALISDVPKTMVYSLASDINSEKEIIPRVIIQKPPSAELRPDQKDEDTLPPYDILDPIIRAYVEDRMSVEEIFKQGYDANTVKRVVAMIDNNEYKRRQAAPGIKITSKAFGLGRRLPIAWKR